MFKTNQKAVWEIKLGYEGSDGVYYPNGNRYYIVATSFDEAEFIARKKLKKPEQIEGITRHEDIEN